MNTSSMNPQSPRHLASMLPDQEPCDLRVKNMVKRYDGFTLDNVSIEVPRGTVVGLIGRNGSGKTTLMKTILGATLSDGGTVELFGRDVTSMTATELTQLRERMAYVSATIAYPSAMTVSNAARMHALAYPRFSLDEFERLCAAMSLDAPKRKVKDLSRGMGMKLQLACALASGADLLILDEPTAGLDPIVRDELLTILRTWMEDERHSMLISSHITSDLEHLADYLVMIDEGHVVLECERDTVSEVMGVAQLRAYELDHVHEAWPFEQTPLRVLDRGLYKSVLVPDRAVFREAFPAYVCDRVSIDEVMTFIVKGEVR